MNRLFGKSLPFLLAILSTCSYGQEVTAQGRSWPVNYGYTPMGRSPPLKGFIVLTNGDTLKGYIKVFAFYDYYPIPDTETNRVQDIYFPNIGSMRIYNNGPYDNGPQGYIDYVNLGTSTFSGGWIAGLNPAHTAVQLAFS
jgi:hypothetical protein